MASPQDGCGFESFPIDPGEERVVRFTYRFRTDCDIDPEPRPKGGEVGSGSVIHGTEIAYDYLGIARRARVELLSPIVVEVMGYCPPI